MIDSNLTISDLTVFSPSSTCQNTTTAKMHLLGSEILKSRFSEPSLKEPQQDLNSSSLKGRVFPISSSGYPNIFYADTKEKRDEIIQKLQLSFAYILPKIKIPYIHPVTGLIELSGFFNHIEEIVQRNDPSAKVYLGGGSIRSIFSFIYKEIFTNYLKNGSNPDELLTQMSLGNFKFSEQDELGNLASMHVLGIESDIDIYIKFSDNLTNTNAAIQETKNFINKTLQSITDTPLKALSYPAADVKEYTKQIQRASTNGGSPLDWIVFPVTSKSGNELIAPNQHKEVLQELCLGKLSYKSITDAENPCITTLRMYRSLFELPFLELNNTDETRFVDDLQTITKKINDSDTNSKVQTVFTKILRNTRFPDRVNYETNPDIINSKSLKRRQEISNLSKQIHTGKSLPALPELLPSLHSPEKLDLDLTQEFEKHNLFMSYDQFIRKHTDQGVLYHGTPDLKNLAPMIRGNLVISSPSQGSAFYGRGFYSTNDKNTAQDYASRDGCVIEFSLKQDNLKVVDISKIPSRIHSLLTEKSKQKGIGTHQYLERYLHVDVIINEHILLQNCRCFSLNKTQESFIKDLYFNKVVCAIKHFCKDESRENILSRIFNTIHKIFNTSIPNIKTLDEKTRDLNKYWLLKSFLNKTEMEWLEPNFNKSTEKLRSIIISIIDKNPEQLNNLLKNSKTLISFDRETSLKLVQADPANLQYLDSKSKDDKETVLTAIHKRPEMFLFASDRLKDDKELALVAINKEPYMFRYASDKLKNDKDFALAAINNIPSMFQYVSNRLKDDKDLALVAIHKNSSMFEYVSDRLKDDKDLALPAITNCLYVFQYVSNRLKDDKDLALTAITNSPSMFQYVSNRLKDDKDLALPAITNSPSMFQYVSNRLKDDKDLALPAITNDPYMFRYVSDRLKDDKDLALAAITNYPYMFYYVSNRLKDDKDLALPAINNAPSMFEWVSDRLKDDKDLALAAVTNSPSMFLYVSDRLKDDKNLALAAFHKNLYMFKCVYDRLKNMGSFARAALNVNLEIYERAGRSFQNLIMLETRKQITSCFFQTASKVWQLIPSIPFR